MGLGHVILGFLSVGPMHGYALKRWLSPALPRGKRINDGLLYPTLSRLEQAGWVRKSSNRKGQGPPRNVFHLTTPGKKEFARWLEDDSDEADEVRYDFLVGHPFLAKCIFFRELAPDVIRDKIATQLEASSAKLRQFEAIKLGMEERGVDPWRISVLELGIGQQRARVRWLKQLPEILAQPRHRRKRSTA